MAIGAEEASRRRCLLVADAYDGQSEVVHLKISPGAASVLLAYEKQVALSAHVSRTLQVPVPADLWFIRRGQMPRWVP
jgi:hypothetical protein